MTALRQSHCQNRLGSARAVRGDWSAVTRLPAADATARRRRAICAICGVCWYDGASRHHEISAGRPTRTRTLRDTHTAEAPTPEAAPQIGRASKPYGRRRQCTAMAAPARPAAAAERRTAVVVIAATVLDLVAFACILPLLPSILQHYESVAPAVRAAGTPGVGAFGLANRDTPPAATGNSRTAGFAGWGPPATTWPPS